MKKFASVLVLSMLLSSFLLAGVAFAQTGTSTPAAGNNADSVTVTVTMTDQDVTLSPDTVTVGQEVNFEFAPSDNDTQDFCVVVLGEDDDTPLNDEADTNTGNAGDRACMTYTFEEAGTYRIAVFEGVDLADFEFGDDTNFANLTVVAANQDTAAAQTTATPAATATSAATTAASSAVTTTGTTTGTTGTTAEATPGNLPTTGGETNTWVPVALMLGALALVAGGLMRFAFRDR